MKTSRFCRNTFSRLRNIIQNEENKNALKRTISNIYKFESFLANKPKTKNIYKTEPDLLHDYLGNFILSVRKPDEPPETPQAKKFNGSIFLPL